MSLGLAPAEIKEEKIVYQSVASNLWMSLGLTPGEFKEEKIIYKLIEDMDLGNQASQ